MLGTDSELVNKFYQARKYWDINIGQWTAQGEKPFTMAITSTCSAFSLNVPQPDQELQSTPQALLPLSRQQPTVTAVVAQAVNACLLSVTAGQLSICETLLWKQSQPQTHITVNLTTRHACQRSTQWPPDSAFMVCSSVWVCA